ncbi:hypothetical protein IFM89_035836 [Coptis chinensis]|uniref:Uncharacterized protein n=1 Tax=Coptis chinensis TaxID=261450 RepID=A0A835HPN8_9MAGN|nr:hypothetical protein IFM89_035836 [Coptis chinensis]
MPFQPQQQLERQPEQQLERFQADQSTFMDDATLGLVHGAQLPADIVYFTQYRDASQLYTHIARCLSGVIGATAELNNRVVSLLNSFTHHHYSQDSKNAPSAISRFSSYPTIRFQELSFQLSSHHSSLPQNAQNTDALSNLLAIGQFYLSRLL